MNKYGGFLKEAANELNIWQGTEEAEDVLKARVIYSMMGRMFLASLWDRDDSDQPVSKTYTRRRIGRMLETFIDLYPETAGILPEETGNFIEELYLNAGFIYNLPNRYAPAAEKVLRLEHIALIRGCAMAGCGVWMSGLGPHRPASGKEGETGMDAIVRMYQLQEHTLSDFRQNLTVNIEWRKLEEEQKAEYLRIEPPFTRGYWTGDACKSGRVSVVRFGEPSPNYYLYRFEGGCIVGHPLPEWTTTNGEYRRIAASLLNECGTLPPIRYRRDEKGKTYEITLGYLLPPAEQNFFEFYSWPLDFRIQKAGGFDRFRRVMASSVFDQAFKPTLKMIGYRFEETEEKFHAGS